MTIADFIEVLSMPGFSEIHIYDEDNDEPSWTGMGNEIPEEYEDSEVTLIDIGSEVITIRI